MSALLQTVRDVYGPRATYAYLFDDDMRMRIWLRPETSAGRYTLAGVHEVADLSPALKTFANNAMPDGDAFGAWDPNNYRHVVVY